MNNLRLGIIGGSGVYTFDQISEVTEHPITTPWGDPSGIPVVGRLESVDVVFISRHGPGHRYTPTEVPYAANICAMKMLGVTHLISIGAVGSLKEHIPPRSYMIPDNLIDRTHARRRTFFDGGIVAHVSMASPFCTSLSANIRNAAATSRLPVQNGGTYICIEGPQFSTIAESELYRTWGASIIGMTALPEARLAREAEMCYACLAMVSDYDVWHQTEEQVSVDVVIENLNHMTDELPNILRTAARNLSNNCEQRCQHALSTAIISDLKSISDETQARIAPIAGKYFPDSGSNS